MFSVVDAVLIRPLPFPHADRISEIWTYYEEGAARAAGSTSDVIAAVRQERDLFDAVAAYQFGSGTLTGTPEPEMLSFASLSPDIFAISQPRQWWAACSPLPMRQRARRSF